ncbi:aspartic peptidase domain-containing protein [Suillus spraguei]|nr:aspartic peptidase domain-containing protein [Suillus spraguei]
MGYCIAAVGIGNPPTTSRTHGLVLPLGTGQPRPAGQHLEVDYGSAIFYGTEYLDTVTLGSGLTITKQSIDLTEGTLTNLPENTIPTVTDNLYKQGTIPKDIVSIFFKPSSSKTETKGELTFSGTDATNPVTTTNPASTYWGINESITYGSTTILSSTAGFVDIRTTYILIASDAYTKYQSATGATSDEVTSLLTVSSVRYRALKNLDFHIGKETYSLTPNAQIWPRSLNSNIGGSSNVIYLVVVGIGRPSGQGFNFVNGYTFLQRFYSVFDTPKSHVGFATTSFTDATTN